jgi:enoyl-CoA hydratase
MDYNMSLNQQYKNILTEIEDGIGFIKINRPTRRNSLNMETLVEIEEALSNYEKDDEVKLIIFTGTDKVFAAGADIAQLRDRKMLEALIPGAQATYNKIENCETPTIALINGYALGGGFELALSCDIRLAAADAKMGLPELNLAIIPGAGGTQRLSRMVGKGKALEMILTGKMVTGEEAERLGIVASSVPGDQLLHEGKVMAEKIMAKGPLAIKLVKMVINKGFDADMGTALLLEKLAQTVAFATEDKFEGTSAFLEKRQPKYRNK